MGGAVLQFIVACMLTVMSAAGGRSVGVDSRSFGDAGGPLRLRGLSAAEPAPPLAAKGFQGDGLNRTFTIVNACNFTVWPATRSNMPVAGGGFELAAGARENVSVPDGWIGNWSPRTGCRFDAAGVGHCEVGDCGGRLACDGDATAMPSDHTVAEFNLDSWGGVTYYDLILAFYSLPIHIQPSDAACAAAGCRSDLNAHCERAPVDGRILSSSGAQLGCKSACVVFGDVEHCMQPSAYSRRQQDICPTGAYTFLDDDATIVCPGRPDFTVTFCGLLQ